MKSFFILAIALMSPLLVSAGCQCEASNTACTQKCGQGIIQCLYGCEANETDACVNQCLDTYWPIIGTQEEVNAKLPFVKRGEEESHDGHKDSHGHGGSRKEMPEKEKIPEEKKLPPPPPPAIEVPHDNRPNDVKDEFKKGEGFGRSGANSIHASVSVMALALVGALLIAL
ncbi:hypothetical protein BC941DRAFT_454955 [Chlamydoabsidia padenii]|nr:hypothetical protein BC941DRAFT_454955 [Chlamydoabsidia padenii]